MILSDRTIRHKAKTQGMIEPFVEKNHYAGLSYGLSPATYDMRLDQDVWLWPGRFVLASTMEYISLPDDVAAVVHDKSTWARRGVAVQNTVIDPGFRGHVTLEITLHALRIIKIRRGTAICQFMFHQLDLPAERPYDGKYQDQQRGPVSPRDA